MGELIISLIEDDSSLFIALKVDWVELIAITCGKGRIADTFEKCSIGKG